MTDVDDIMAWDRFVELLGRDRPNSAQRGPACPDEEELSGYVDDVVDVETMQKIEAHLAQCYPCRLRVAAVVRATDGETSEAVPELLLARARRVIRVGGPQRLRDVRIWAAAATVLLAFGLLIAERPPETNSDSTLVPTTRESRFAERGPVLPKIALPAENAIVAANELAVRWRAVPGSRYYELRIVTDAGDLVWQERVTRTDWTPRAKLTLQPGAQYFVRVDAFVDDGKPISSEHVMFKVAPQG
jgi:hypothetical protein